MTANPARLRAAVRQARQLQRSLKRGDREALTQAVMLQGILSGDVVSASIVERQRLQKENLKLRQRLTHAKLRTERAKAVLIERAAFRPPALSGIALVNELRAIYGFDPLPLPRLPAHVDVLIVPPVSPQSPPGKPVSEEKTIEKAPQSPLSTSGEEVAPENAPTFPQEPTG